MLLNLSSIALIFLGESAAIYAEVISSKLMEEKLVWPLFGTNLSIMVVGCILLLFGYILGVRSFQSIWVVSVISITSILIAEPILNWLIFEEMPARGPLIGFVLGIMGFIFALF